MIVALPPELVDELLRLLNEMALLARQAKFPGLPATSAHALGDAQRCDDMAEKIRRLRLDT